MMSKEQVVFDIKSEKFRYLKRENNKNKRIVNIDVLNKRLNRVKKINNYTNVKMIFFSLIIVIIFTTISIQF